MVGSGIHYMDHPKDKDHSFAFSLTSSNKMSNTIPTTSNQIKFSHPTFAAFQSPTKKNKKKLAIFSVPQKISSLLTMKNFQRKSSRFFGPFFFTAFCHRKTRHLKGPKDRFKTGRRNGCPQFVCRENPNFSS